MSAAAIQKAAKKRGYKVKVEIQGSMGIENALSPKEIAEADLIIFANDVGISKMERFANVEEKIKRLKPHEVIKNAEIIFE